ncbi:hypothetical protein ACG97_00085 [Vogesella sp. EB]|uniref:2-methylaconitate cis-trans isomerase PrpF family protein n=1 Tax=Vogesella sp. EB TaxID=1526735 RepID=UPI00064D445C|nr:PrpF domain-containing protein [Vogesella sp. EB]KMJ54727.1 hypothetical protein ACG97_00085 [Vogesella sp. EB]
MSRLDVTLLRGGTSKGLFFRHDDLPPAGAARDALLLRVLGSPDPYGKQIDGLGTGISTTSKVVLLRPSERDDHDIDYLFGHVSIAEPLIDWSGNCGNLSAAVPLFALLQGMVAHAPRDGAVSVRIWQANIGKTIIAELAMRDGRPVWEGDYRIDGVAFPGAPLTLRFLDPAGGASGRLFPTGRVCDSLSLPDGSRLTATLIDAGNPTVFVRAADVGLVGDERGDIADAAVNRRLEWARAAGAVAMGLCADIDSASRERPATPKVSFVSPNTAPGVALTARILSMGRLHHAYTGTGAIALAAAAAIDGTLVAEVCGGVVRGEALRFAHASGQQQLEARLSSTPAGWHIDEVVMTRTARPLLQGSLFLPSQY